MHSMYTRRRLLYAGAGAAWAIGLAQPDQTHTLASPNRRIRVVVRVSAATGLSLAVLLDGSKLLGCSRLGLDLGETGRLDRLRLVRTTRSRVDDDYILVCGKTRQVASSGHQLVLHLSQDRPASGGRALQLIVRAYDDGVAFRYVVDAPAGPEPVIVRAELTRFDFPRDYAGWGLDLRAFNTSHEGEFKPFRASGIQTASLFDAPLVCLTGQGAFAIAEADLEAYAACYLTGRDDGRLGIQVRLSPRVDDPTIAVRLPPASRVVSPWRVIMIGDEPGRLIVSTLITTLSAASRIADTRWIQPGKAAWNWWSGAALSGVDGPLVGNATMMGLIDFAAATGLQYLLIDAGWYAGPDRAAWPEVDITRSVPEIDLPVLVRYGRERGIGLFVWLNWRHLDAQLEQALTLYQRLGLRGIKVDFMNRDDQEMLAFYHRLLSSAAAHHLMVDLHGATHPTGLQRTYPNLVTQEAVMGAEYNKWGNRVTSGHNVTLAYTRMLLGPMDYTPGGFRNVTPEQFVARDTLPMVQTTRGQALAMYVVYDSPFCCVSDTPDAYKGQAGVDFLAAVPTSWDEIRVLGGRIAEFIIIARRQGASWYIGAMTNAQARTVSIPLGLLGEGRFTATIYADGRSPALLVIERNRTVSRSDVINLALAANGGGVIVLRPLAMPEHS